MRDDGTIDKAAMEADLPEIVMALKSGNPEILDMDQTEPDDQGKYLLIFSMQAH